MLDDDLINRLPKEHRELAIKAKKWMYTTEGLNPYVDFENLLKGVLSNCRDENPELEMIDIAKEYIVYKEEELNGILHELKKKGQSQELETLYLDSFRVVKIQLNVLNDILKSNNPENDPEGQEELDRKVKVFLLNHILQNAETVNKLGNRKRGALFSCFVDYSLDSLREMNGVIAEGKIRIDELNNNESSAYQIAIDTYHRLT